MILIFAVFHVVLGTARIRAGNGEIVSTTRVLGIGSTKRFPISDIEAILPVTSGQQGGNQGNTLYAIRLRTKNGRRFTLADEISSRQEARWIVSQIETLAGLKIDTRVELDSRFGPPPQPGQALIGAAQSGVPGPGALRPGFQRTGPQSRTATIISFAVFAMCVGGMFAWQGWRWSTFKSMANSSRANNSRNAKSGATARERSVFAGSMTDADEERVLELPAQAQAEELLERAISHDERARELFERQVESWVGHIRLTDQMRQLDSSTARYFNQHSRKHWQVSRISRRRLLERSDRR